MKMRKIAFSFLISLSLISCSTNLKLKESEKTSEYYEQNKFNSSTIYFDLNSSEVDFEARSILEEQINFISVNPNYSVLIEGHCDERGTREYNLALGERRADSVKRFISSFGIDPDRISTISYGKENPAVEGASQDIWSKNRRAEIVIE